MKQCRVARHARPVALERKLDAFGYANRTEHAPSRQKADLAGREQLLRIIVDLIIEQNAAMDHGFIVAESS